jgi:hypothetical protein
MGEKAGTPSIGVMTANFVSAAQLMARVLGVDGFGFVTIEHPISSASLEALAERARRAVADGLRLVLPPGATGPAA